MIERVRRTYSEIFLNKLEEVSGGEQKLIGNRVLREALGWNRERYDQIYEQLHEEGLIIVGRGQGGTVGLANLPGSEALKVFISYSHVDSQFKTDLLKHLEPLRKEGLVETWTDQEILAGDEWDEEISDAMESADIILLLVSIDFINSKYCYGVELEKALSMNAQGEARVVPVILRSCLWNRTSFARLQALPRDGKAISTWQDRDEAFANVAEGIRNIADELLRTE